MRERHQITSHPFRSASVSQSASVSVLAFLTPPSSAYSCSSNKESAQSSGGSAEWKANPLFRGIEPQQIRRSAEDQRRAPFLKLCNEARRASQELIETLAAAADDDADEPAGASTAHQPTPATADLEQMTKNALALADQAIIECLVDKRSAARC